MPKPVAFKTVYTAMQAYKARVAPGGDCDAWEDFAEHTRKRLGQSPWNLPGSLSVSRQFADYWLAVAEGACADYEASTAHGSIRQKRVNEKAPPLNQRGSKAV